MRCSGAGLRLRAVARAVSGGSRPHRPCERWPPGDEPAPGHSAPQESAVAGRFRLHPPTPRRRGCTPGPSPHGAPRGLPPSFSRGGCLWAGGAERGCRDRCAATARPGSTGPPPAHAAGHTPDGIGERASEDPALAYEVHRPRSRTAREVCEPPDVPAPAPSPRHPLPYLPAAGFSVMIAVPARQGQRSASCDRWPRGPREDRRLRNDTIRGDVPTLAPPGRRRPHARAAVVLVRTTLLRKDLRCHVRREVLPVVVHRTTVTEGRMCALCTRDLCFDRPARERVRVAAL